MKLQIWKQAVWQFLLNASFCRCTAAMSDLAHVFLKHLPRGPKTADYLKADPNVLCESFEPLLTDLACRLQGGRASKKKLEWSLSEAFGRSMSPAESKCFAERLLAGLEHIYNKRRQATSGAKLQPPVQRIVKAISSSSLELLPAAIQGPKIDPSSLSPSQIREQYAKQLSALPEVASDIDESAPSASPEAGVEAICVESSQGSSLSEISGSSVKKKPATKKRPASAKEKPKRKKLAVAEDGKAELPKISHDEACERMPNGCGRCRRVKGCTPPCWRKKGLQLVR